MRLYRFYLLLLFALAVSLVSASAQYVEEMDLRAFEDATVSSLDPGANYGDNPDLIALAWTANDNVFILRSLMRFELPVLPEGDELLEASLSLYATSGSTNPGHMGFNEALITRVEADWNPALVTWENQPEVSIEHALFTPRSDGPTQDFTELDVTEMLRDLLEERRNHPADPSPGLRIQLQSEAVFRSINFASSDHANPELHPRLHLRISRPNATGLEAQVGSETLQVEWGPNPVQDELLLNISTSANQRLDEGTRLEVYSTDGRCLATKELGVLSSGLSRHTLNAADWPAGQLFLQLTTAEGRPLAAIRLVKS